MHLLILLLALAYLALPCLGAESPPEKPSIGIRKLRDITIYSDDKFYCAFPSIVVRRDGELIVAFRRAPERRAFGETGVTHTDANAYLMLSRSTDAGQTWSEPELLFAHPLAGSQDPCMVQLKNQSLICTSYAWAWVQTSAIEKMKQAVHYGNYVFLGGYLLRSEDGGHHW